MKRQDRPTVLPPVVTNNTYFPTQKFLAQKQQITPKVSQFLKHKQQLHLQKVYQDQFLRKKNSSQILRELRQQEPRVFNSELASRRKLKAASFVDSGSKQVYNARNLQSHRVAHRPGLGSHLGPGLSKTHKLLPTESSHRGRIPLKPHPSEIPVSVNEAYGFRQLSPPQQLFTMNGSSNLEETTFSSPRRLIDPAIGLPNNQINQMDKHIHYKPSSSFQNPLSDLKSASLIDARARLSQSQLEMLNNSGFVPPTHGSSIPLEQGLDFGPPHVSFLDDDGLGRSAHHHSVHKKMPRRVKGVTLNIKPDHQYHLKTPRKKAELTSRRERSRTERDPHHDRIVERLRKVKIRPNRTMVSPGKSKTPLHERPSLRKSQKASIKGSTSLMQRSRSHKRSASRGSPPTERRSLYEKRSTHHCDSTKEKSVDKPKFKKWVNPEAESRIQKRRFINAIKHQPMDEAAKEELIRSIDAGSTAFRSLSNKERSMFSQQPTRSRGDPTRSIDKVSGPMTPTKRSVVMSGPQSNRISEKQSISLNQIHSPHSSTGKASLPPVVSRQIHQAKTLTSKSRQLHNTNSLPSLQKQASQVTKQTGHSPSFRHREQNASALSSTCKSKKSAAISQVKGVSPEVARRLTGQYDRDRKICSSHKHDAVSIIKSSEGSPYPLASSIKRKSTKKQVTLITPQAETREQGTQSANRHTRALGSQVSDGAFSMEAVNIMEVQKDVREAACDPIPHSARHIQTQTSKINPPSSVKSSEREVPEVNSHPGELAKQASLLSAKSLKSKSMVTSPQNGSHQMSKTGQSFHREQDWSSSKLFEFVKQLTMLPPANRIERAKEIEAKFFNPEGRDIFTEEEVQYNASLLRKQDQHEGSRDEPLDQLVLEELYDKGGRTIDLLSEHLLLGKANAAEDIFDQISEQQPKKRKILYLNNIYRQASVPTVIKLLLRCRKLYDALYELKKVLQLVIQQEDMFDPQGLIYKGIAKYDKGGKKLEAGDEAAIVRGLNILVKVSRKISQFLRENRAFKAFTYKQKDHLSTLLMHAKNLAGFLREHNSSREEMFRYPALDEVGCLVFYQSPQPDPAAVQASEVAEKKTEDENASRNSAVVRTNLQDADDANDLPPSEKRRSVADDLGHRTQSIKDPKVIMKETEMTMFAEEPQLSGKGGRNPRDSMASYPVEESRNKPSDQVIKQPQFEDSLSRIYRNQPTETLGSIKNDLIIQTGLSQIEQASLPVRSTRPIRHEQQTFPNNFQPHIDEEIQPTQLKKQKSEAGAAKPQKSLHSKHFEAAQEFNKIAYDHDSSQFQSITEKAESQHEKKIRFEQVSTKLHGTQRIPQSKNNNLAAHSSLPQFLAPDLVSAQTSDLRKKPNKASEEGEKSQNTHMTLPNIEGVLMKIDHLIGAGISPSNLPHVQSTTFKNAVESASEEIMSPTPPPRVPSPVDKEPMDLESHSKALNSLLATKIHPKTTVYKNTEQREDTGGFFQFSSGGDKEDKSQPGRQQELVKAEFVDQDPYLAKAIPKDGQGVSASTRHLSNIRIHNQKQPVKKMITSREAANMTNRTSENNPLSAQTEHTHKMELSQRVGKQTFEKSSAQETDGAGMLLLPTKEENNNNNL